MIRRFSRALVLLSAVHLVVAQHPAAGETSAAVAPPPQLSAEAPPFVPGQVLLGVDRRADLPEVALHARASSRQPLPHRHDVLVLDVPAGQEWGAARAVRDLAGVRWASPNFIANAADVPDDPGYARQWNLGTRARALGAANWQPVHGTGVDGSGVVVAVIDTGVNANPDLDDVVAGYDFVDADNNPADEQGHGTHVAGTVAQSTDNRIGVAGVAPDASVLAIRALDAAGRGTYADLISAIAFAVDRGASVLNLSFGGATAGGLCDAVARAVSEGAVVVTAAGNDAGPVAFPAACPEAIAVSATAIDATITSYSNRGPEIDLAAPGGDTSSDLDRDGHSDGIVQYSTFNGVGNYYYSAGTSMAAPHVAGAVALLLEANPSLTPAQVRTALLSSALDLGVPGADPLYGAGLLDIAGAVSAASTTPPTEPAPVEPAPEPTPVEPAPQPTPVAPGPVEPEPGLDDNLEPGTEPAPDTAPAPTETVSRVSGPDRYTTSVAASTTAFQGGAMRVILASGATFPDALASSGLSDVLNAPVLLTPPCQLQESVGAELERLGPAELLVVGGSQAICEQVAVEAALRAGAPVRRISGETRYDTAAALSREGFDAASTVFIAAGHGFADSLAGGAAAAEQQGPLLLTDRCSLPPATAQALERLHPSRVLVLGGSNAICDDVLASIRSSVPTATVTRLAGRDRYSTAVATSQAAFPDRVPVVAVASGTTFADGLSGGSLAAVLDAPLLLVPPCDLPSGVLDALSQFEPDRILILGGSAAVCDEVASRLADP